MMMSDADTTKVVDDIPIDDKISDGNDRMPRKETVGKALLLLALYIVQGLPAGFQSKTLPVYLRSKGYSLSKISAAGVLSAPWLLKSLWAPLVDVHYWPNIGRRKSWILPAQVILGITCCLAGWFSSMIYVVAAVFIMNFAAATQDIAVDALAVDILDSKELGYGNAAQTVGFKIGILLGGGVLVHYINILGLPMTAVFPIMGAIVFAVLAIVYQYQEPRVQVAAQPAKPTAVFKSSFSKFFHSTFNGKQGVALLGLIMSYKTGEVLNDVMFKPFLVDNGYSVSEITLWTGIYTMSFSILGSVLGGVISHHISLVDSLTLTMAIRILPQIGRFWLAFHPSELSPTSILFVACGEALFGGALSTCMFAFMMKQVDKAHAASHYTFLSTLEIIGKSGAGFLSGPITEHLGYATVFGLGTLLCCGCMAFLIPFRRDNNSIGKQQ